MDTLLLVLLLFWLAAVVLLVWRIPVPLEPAEPPETVAPAEPVEPPELVAPPPPESRGTGSGKMVAAPMRWGTPNIEMYLVLDPATATPDQVRAIWMTPPFGGAWAAPVANRGYDNLYFLRYLLLR